MAEMENRIVLNVPHSSIGGIGAAGWSDDEELLKAVYAFTDWHTNILFRPDSKVFGPNDVRMHVFRWSSFKLGINKPYSNSLQPVREENLAKLRHGYASFMIEVNKSTYLTDGGFTLCPGWTRLKSCIDEIFSFISIERLQTDSRE